MSRIFSVVVDSVVDIVSIFIYLLPRIFFLGLVRFCIFFGSRWMMTQWFLFFSLFLFPFSSNTFISFFIVEIFHHYFCHTLIHQHHHQEIQRIRTFEYIDHHPRIHWNVVFKSCLFFFVCFPSSILILMMISIDTSMGSFRLSLSFSILIWTSWLLLNDDDDKCVYCIFLFYWIWFFCCCCCWFSIFIRTVKYRDGE